MQQGSARPFAVTYMTVHGLRHIDHGEPSSCRLRLMPGSDTAPDALNVMPSERAMAAASSRWPASSRVMRSYSAWSGRACPIDSLSKKTRRWR